MYFILLSLMFVVLVVGGILGLNNLKKNCVSSQFRSFKCYGMDASSPEKPSMSTRCGQKTCISDKSIALTCFITFLVKCTLLAIQGSHRTKQGAKSFSFQIRDFHAVTVRQTNIYLVTCLHKTKKEKK